MFDGGTDVGFVGNDEFINRGLEFVGFETDARGGVALRVEVAKQDFLPFSVKAQARLTAVVVLPTPPFWLISATILAIGVALSRPQSGFRTVRADFDMLYYYNTTG